MISTRPRAVIPVGSWNWVSAGAGGPELPSRETGRICPGFATRVIRQSPATKDLAQFSTSGADCPHLAVSPYCVVQCPRYRVDEALDDWPWKGKPRNSASCRVQSSEMRHSGVRTTARLVRKSAIADRWVRDSEIRCRDRNAAGCEFVRNRIQGGPRPLSGRGRELRNGRSSSNRMDGGRVKPRPARTIVG